MSLGLDGLASRSPFAKHSVRALGGASGIHSLIPSPSRSSDWKTKTGSGQMTFTPPCCAEARKWKRKPRMSPLLHVEPLCPLIQTCFRGAPGATVLHLHVNSSAFGHSAAWSWCPSPCDPPCPSEEVSTGAGTLVLFLCWPRAACTWHGAGAQFPTSLGGTCSSTPVNVWRDPVYAVSSCPGVAIQVGVIRPASSALALPLHLCSRTWGP